MIKIYKQTLKIHIEQFIQLQIGSEILSVQEQYGLICLWYRCDTENQNKQRLIHIYGTGQPCDDSLQFRFIGTVQIGSFVWHVFIDKND